jgi:histidine ammonia-lyase
MHDAAVLEIAARVQSLLEKSRAEEHARAYRIQTATHTSKTMPQAICGCILALETTSLTVALFKFRP